MEIIIGLILIAVILYLLWLLIKYVLAPIASILVTVIVVISAGYALIISLKSFTKSIKEHIDPYQTYVDKHADISGGIRRNYFFGPGFHQIFEIVAGAFAHLGEERKKLREWKDKKLQYVWFWDMWIYLGYFVAIVCALVLGFIWNAAFSILLAAVIIIGMTGFFSFFSLLWLTDRIVLIRRSIHNRCPICKRKSVIPVFICPSCGAIHKKLVPGPYGIMKHKCTCGTDLATTFLGGRSKYESHCPYCDTKLFSSSSQQYGIQLVGGIGTGKTTFLAAFWHEYAEWLRYNSDVRVEAMPEEAFDKLVDWFDSGESEATLETNATMYSIIHTQEQHTPVQMTIYDIAGEVFDFAESEVQQQQFRYCEGFLVIIDPTSTPDYASETITNFINTLNDVMGKNAAMASSVPVAVVITKADKYKKEIGLPRISSLFKIKLEEDYEISAERHQNDTCRGFLLDHGYENSVNLIESSFVDVRYFPVSAMGHDQEEGQYEPWGVLDPVFWLMKHDKCPLRSIIRI
ncbi:hypothetical protein SAMN02910456_01222 [Ruminococcaceae bacterium YRB3002]|nr:hypothetical protein SAMN02910456_01222 [Ruminococcaceae bacterium YRB3002]